MSEDLTLMPLKRSNSLRAEAEYLHRQLFHRAPKDQLVSDYRRAHAEIADLQSLGAKEVQTVNAVVGLRLDALGIEPWLRHQETGRHALSVKLLLLAYLAESDAGHPEFLRTAVSGRKAIAHMCWATLSGVFRLLRGRAQIAWHDLV